jgi:hypothetical protein
MLYAVHCDQLVLGIGKTATRAEKDAVAHGAELDGCDTCRITLEAATHVLAHGDCRGLRFHPSNNPDSDYFSLRGESL